MTDKKIGFIGAGNMGYAMITGIVNSGAAAPGNIAACDTDEEKIQKLHLDFNLRVTDNPAVLAEFADIIFIAVKPDDFTAAAREAAPFVNDKKIIISAAAGIRIRDMEAIFGNDKKIARTMPNTPALAREGMTAVCFNGNVTPKEQEYALLLLNAFGKARVIPEKLFHSAIGISGSSPAYVFMFIEAMADAAVRDGMPREQAYTFAAQAVYGSAKLLMESGKHPGALKDMVCSPGGTTVEAVAALEKHGFRAAVMEGVRACIEKSRGMEGS